MWWQIFYLEINKQASYSGNHHPCSIHPNWVDLSEALYDLTWFVRRWSALTEVKIRQIIIHEPFSFLKCGNKFQSIHMRHFATRLDSNRVASHANQLPAWRVDNRGNDSCLFNYIVESTIFLTHPASPHSTFCVV